MKKHVSTPLLLLIAAMALTASCQRMGKDLAQKVKSELKEKKGTPRYLRDSEKWGKVIRQELDLEDFDAIRTVGSVDIVFTQGDDFEVVAEGNEQVLPLYSFEVEKHSLNCYQKENFKEKVPSMRLLVTAPYIERIDIKGAGDVDMREGVNMDNDLTVNMHGAGDLDIYELYCENLKIDIHGAGDADILQLFCNDLDISVKGAGDTRIKEAKCSGNASFGITGAGDIRAELECQDLNIDVKGAGEADIRTQCKTVTASASGTGEVEVKGTAEKLIRHESGLAKVVTKKLAVTELERK